MIKKSKLNEKPTAKKDKLRLQAETLRQLNQEQLHTVAGALARRTDIW